MSLFDKRSFYYPYPANLPIRLVYILIFACLLIGLLSLRHGWLAVFENWLLMLLIYPLATAVIALPFKYRDPTFELKNAYYLGMFVALLYTLAKLRYWR